MKESGEGYTLSGKPLDVNSASARAYGLGDGIACCAGVRDLALLAAARIWAFLLRVLVDLFGGSWHTTLALTGACSALWMVGAISYRKELEERKRKRDQEIQEAIARGEAIPQPPVPPVPREKKERKPRKRKEESAAAVEAAVSDEGEESEEEDLDSPVEMDSETYAPLHVLIHVPRCDGDLCGCARLMDDCVGRRALVDAPCTHRRGLSGPAAVPTITTWLTRRTPWRTLVVFCHRLRLVTTTGTGSHATVRGAIGQTSAATADSGQVPTTALHRAVESQRGLRGRLALAFLHDRNHWAAGWLVR